MSLESLKTSAHKACAMCAFSILDAHVTFCWVKVRDLTVELTLEQKMLRKPVSATEYKIKKVIVTFISQF